MSLFGRLGALVGVGGPTLNYTVEEPPYERAWGQWTHHRGTSKEDGSAVSVFRFTSADPNDRRLALARNGIRRLKMLRHPNILAYKDSLELQEKGQTVIFLVTAPVKPLKLVLEDLNLQGQHRDEYLAMGLLHITNAVSFLNNDCKLIHGNICLDAVVVTETLDWKLHGFDLLSEHTLQGDFCLTHASWMVGAQYKPGELGKSDWDTIRDAPPWAVDAWGLGCLMQEAFSRQYMTSMEQLRRTDSIPQALLSDYQKLLSSTPARRLNPSKVAESKFLNNRLVDIVAFMENIAVKDSLDKESFFKKLGNALPAIPAAVAQKKILPLLSHALEFGGAPPTAVGPLLQIGNTLDSDEFTKKVVPTLSKLFASQDRTLRRSLLESIDTYSQHLSTQVLEDQIYVHLQSGFTDQNAYIRELTLKSILPLAPRLSNKTLVNNVLKHLSKLQVDEEHSIRANTTVLLGNIAKYLGESTCKRVLINAFTRALRDNFPPAKIAGLRAMVATSQYYDPEDAATKILPAVAPLTIEPVAEVRSSALSVLEVFTKVLKEADAKRAAESPADGHSSMGGMGGAAPIQAAGSSMLTWAVSSLMTTTGLAVKAPGAAPPAAAAGGPPAAAGAPPAPATSSTRPASVASTTAGSQPSSSGRIPAVGSGTGLASHSRNTSTAGSGSGGGAAGGGDGWGDGDGWDEEDLQVDEEEAKARARLSAASSRPSRPAAPPAPVASSSRKAADGWDAGGDDDGLLEGLDAPAPKPAPARPRVGSGRGAGSTGAAGAAKPKSGGGMKLGAQKLGVQKLGPTGDAFFDDADKW